MTVNDTYTRGDLSIGTDDEPTTPTVPFGGTGEWQQKIVAGVLVAGTIALVPLTATNLDYDVKMEERPTHASLLGAQRTADQPVSAPRKIDLREAIRLAEANFRRVETLLDNEVKRDALGSAVWEEE